MDGPGRGAGGASVKARSIDGPDRGAGGVSAEARARIARVAVLVAGAWLAGCVPVDSFFFAPERADGYDFENVDGELTDPHPSTIGPALRREGFVSTEHGEVHWIFARHPDARDVVLYSHGNSHHIGYYWDRVERLHALGFHVLAYDYPGYGRSEGEPSDEAVYASARAVRRLLDGFEEAEGARVYAYGFSLGGAPSFELAAAGERGDVPPVDGVIGEAAWCSIEEVLRDGTQVGLQGHYLTDLEMDSCARLADLTSTPVLLMHGTEDAVILVRHSTLLERAADAVPIEVHRVEGATHADLPLVAADDYDRWILDFVR